MDQNGEIVQSWDFSGDDLRVSVTGRSVPISVVAPVVASPQQVLLSEKEQTLCPVTEVQKRSALEQHFLYSWSFKRDLTRITSCCCFTG